MNEYYEVPFKQRYPSVRVAWDGFLVGVLIAPALAAAIGFFMWMSGANFVFVLGIVAEMTFFLLLALGFGLPSFFVLRYYNRVTHVETTLPQTSQSTSPQSPELLGPNSEWANPDSLTGLIYLIKSCAIEMARLKSDGQEPTREFVTSQYPEYNQPMWNSARLLLQIAGIVNGKSWLNLDLNKIRILMGRVDIEGNDRIVIPHISSGGHLQYRHISTSPGEKNSYIET